MTAGPHRKGASGGERGRCRDGARAGLWEVRVWGQGVGVFGNGGHRGPGLLLCSLLSRRVFPLPSPRAPGPLVRTVEGAEDPRVFGSQLGQAEPADGLGGTRWTAPSALSVLGLVRSDASDRSGAHPSHLS